MFAILSALSIITQMQSIIDIGVGTSNINQNNTNFSYRHQVSDNFRVAIEIQYGSPKYSFLGEKPFEKGYACRMSAPLSFKIAEQEGIKLDGFVRPGFRFQGIIDPYNNDCKKGNEK